jgi:putative copper resistance protein D
MSELSGLAERSRASLVGAAVLAAGVLAAAVAVSGVGPYVALGWGDPGGVVRWAMPLARLLADGAATVAVGAAVFAVAFAVPAAAGRLSPCGYRAVLSAGRWAWLWAVAALLMVPLSLAVTAGGPRPVARLALEAGPWQLWSALDAGEQPLAWLVTAGVAVAVALGSRLVLHWRSATGLALVATAGLLPALATGHASSQTSHDVSVSALWWHVPAAVIWLGLLVALCRPSWQRGPGAPDPGTVQHRYRRLAGGCAVVVALSGLLTATELVPADTLLSSGYGWSCLGVAGAAAGLAVMWLRRRPRPGEHGRLRWLASELALLAGAMGLSAAATVLAPPALLRPVDALQTLLGYELAGPPTLARLALDWRIDVVFAPLSALAAAGYLVAARRVRRWGRAWPRGRAAAWTAGCAVVLIATSSGIGRYAAAMFSVHMASHMLLAVLAPVLLALGAPITLAREASRPAPRGEPFGPREWLETFVDSPLLRRLAHPVIAAVLFAGAPFALYLTGLFDAAARYRWAEVVIDAVLLAIGVLFAEVTVGVDEVAERWPIWIRLGVLFAAMPFGAVFAALLARWPTAIGNGPASSNMYSSLALPWTVGRLLADQQIAAALALGLGEAALLVAVGSLVWRWDRRGRTASELSPGFDSGPGVLMTRR